MKLIAIFLTGVCASFSWSAQAQDTEAPLNKLSFKLTPTYFSSADGNNAFDVNLRAATGEHTLWVGHYRDHEGFEQSRAGYDLGKDFGFIRPVFSVQKASHGFWGGSVTAEVGDKTFAIVGWGRTNLRDYYNLNFDPNDAITLGLGTRALDKTELSLVHIWDDRLRTRQRVTHLVSRYRPQEGQRWTVDASYKTGTTSSGAYVRGLGLSVGFDYGAYFARLARDPYANFSDSSQNRISVGMRF